MLLTLRGMEQELLHRLDTMARRSEAHQQRVEERQERLEGAMNQQRLAAALELGPKKLPTGSRMSSREATGESVAEGCLENKSRDPGALEHLSALELRQEARLKDFQASIEGLMVQQLKSLETAIDRHPPHAAADHLAPARGDRDKPKDMDASVADDCHLGVAGAGLTRSHRSGELQTKNTFTLSGDPLVAEHKADATLRSRSAAAAASPELSAPKVVDADEPPASAEADVIEASGNRSINTSEPGKPKHHVHHGAASADLIEFCAKPELPKPELQRKHYIQDKKNKSMCCLQAKVHTLVFGQGFENGVGMLIVLNALFLGVAMQFDAPRAFRNEPPAAWEFYGEVFFATLFSIEFALRVFAEGLAFIVSPAWRWHLFDFVVIASSIVSIMGDTFNLGALRALRILRMAKIMRVLKVVTYLKELRLMIDSLLCCAMSLFWAIVLLALVIFLFGSFLAEAVRTHLRDADAQLLADPIIIDGLREYHNSLFSTMIFLSIAVVGGGVDWYDVALPFVYMNWMYGVAFMVFAFGILLGMLNVLTGIFVDSATHIGALDEELVIEKLEEAKKTTIMHIKHIFSEIDKDGSGYITSQEMKEVIDNKHVHGFLKSIDIEPAQAAAFFNLLDADKTHMISIDEFMAGCLRIKGGAKSLDIAIMMTDNKRLAAKVHHIREMSDQILDRFGRIEGALGIASPAIAAHPATADIDLSFVPDGPGLNQEDSI